MTMRSRHRMPKNKKQFETCLENAFLAGCSWGYGVEHTKHIAEQEQLGADAYLGRISIDEAGAKIEKLWESED